jgi:hypothetical protein
MLNKFKSFLILILVLLFQSCSTLYYVGETNEPTNIYSTNDQTDNVVYVIPAGTKVLIEKKYKRSYSVICDKYKGYSFGSVFNNYHKFNSDYDGILYGYSTSTKKNTNNYSSSKSYSGSSGGSVNVKGYYRKNGTYVRPHTRSAPKRR